MPRNVDESHRKFLVFHSRMNNLQLLMQSSDLKNSLVYNLVAVF